MLPWNIQFSSNIIPWRRWSKVINTLQQSFEVLWACAVPDFILGAAPPKDNILIHLVHGHQIWIWKKNQIWLEQPESLHSEIPPDAPWLPILVIHIRSQVKTTRSQSYKFLKIAKNFEILQETLHTTHLLKLLDMMYKYEMDPIRSVGATERTWVAGQMDGWSETNIPP